MRLSIHSFSMEDAPSYHAISYTWGNEKDQERILVKHASRSPDDLLETEPGRYGLMTVRKNCADVLRQLLHFKTSRYYWIDAICINQRNLEEKSVQVWRMGETFRQADTVLVCIGMHDESSRLVVSMFESFHSHISKSDIVSVLKSRISRPHHPSIKALEELVFDWVQSIDISLFIDFYHAMMALAERSYFWRSWTLQELWIARQLKCFCGEDELDLPSFVWWSQGTSTWDKTYMQERPQLQLLVDMMYDDRHHSGLWVSLGAGYESILRGCHVNSHNSPPTLWEYTPYRLIRLCRRHKCQDPRDIVYGTLSLSDWMTGRENHSRTWAEWRDEPALLLPDYSQSAFELAKRVLHLFARIRIDISMLEEMCTALDLRTETEESRHELALRSSPGLWEPRLSSLESVQRTKDSGDVVHHTVEGYRLGSKGPLFYLKSASDETRTFTSILNCDDYYSRKTCVAIACNNVQDGDWLVPILFGRAVILRECGSHLFFIGKAITAASACNFCTRKPIEIRFGLADLIVFLCGLKIDWLHQTPCEADGEFETITNDGKLVGSEETVLAWLHGQFCGERNSSWALAPTAAGDEVNE